jgi:hypothetical protein
MNGSGITLSFVRRAAIKRTIDMAEMRIERF